MRKMFVRRRGMACFVSLVFFWTTLCPLMGWTGPVSDVGVLPPPGAMLAPTPVFQPPLIKGVKVFLQDPLRFDFIVSRGENTLQGQAFQQASLRMTKYFLASLTIPDDQRWVNLSPHEQGRVIPEALGETDMGRDLLAQDYLLKQLSASLMYPEKSLGKAFWQKIYAEAYRRYGTAEIPVNTFHKVWVVPDEAVVYEQPDTDGQGVTAVVLKQHLKVLLEKDYLAWRQKDDSKDFLTEDKDTQDSFQTDVIREVVVPAIEKEINTGQTFVRLRQIYQAMILATWYRQYLREGLLARVYFDQGKTAGLRVDGQEAFIQQVYDRYLRAFRQGVFNYIKEDYDPKRDQVVPRKYFAGGLLARVPPGVIQVKRSSSSLSRSEQAELREGQPIAVVSVRMADIGPKASQDNLRKARRAAGSSPVNPGDYKQVPDYVMRKIKASLITPKIYLPEVDEVVDLERYLEDYRFYYRKGSGLSDPVIWDNEFYLNVRDVDDVDEMVRIILRGVFTRVLMDKETVDASQKVTEWLETYWHRSFRESKESYLTYIVGGTGGKFVAAFKRIFEKVKKGTVTFIISPFDDGGGSRRLIDELKDILGYWTPPAGDQMNILSGLTAPFLSDLIRARITKRDSLYAKSQTLTDVLETMYAQMEKQDGVDKGLLKRVRKKLAVYVPAIDRYIREGRISLQGQSVGNLIHAAVMLHEGIYAPGGLDQEHYQKGMDILMDIFEIDNVRILLSSFDEAVLYARLKLFEIGTRQEPLRRGVVPNGQWVDVGGLHVAMTALSDRRFEVSIQEYPDYHLVLEEIFGPRITTSTEKARRGSRTVVRLYYRGKEVPVETRSGGRVVTSADLPVDGRALDIVTEDFHLKVKGRLVIGQTHITDSLHHSAPEEFGFVNGKRPKVNPQVLEAMEHTEGLIAVGPGSRLTSIDAVLKIEGVLNELKKIRRKGKIPVVKVENPVRDNETVGMSYEDVLRALEYVLKGPMRDFFNFVVLNDKETSLRNLSDEERLLLDEYVTRKNRLVDALERDPESFSKIAKLRRGLFEGSSREYKRVLEQEGVTVIYTDALKKIVREGRGEDADVAIGFPLDKLAAMFEDIIYEKNTKAGIYWKALMVNGLSESVVLRMLHEVSLIYPNMSFAERVKFLYDIRTKEDKGDLGLPLFDKKALKNLRPDLLVMNFAGTQGYAGLEKRRTVSPDVIEAYIRFLETNPNARMLIRTGVGFQELRDLLLDQVPPELRHRIIVASNSGAVIYGFDVGTGKASLRSRVEIHPKKRRKIKEIIHEGVRRFGFDRTVRNTFGDVVAHPVDETRIREREAQFVIELEEYMIHPILRRLTKDPRYADVAQEFSAYLNQRLAEEGLAFRSEVVGIGAVNVVAKNIPSLEQIIRQVIDEDFERDVPNERILFLGRGFTTAAKAFQGATYIVFGPSQELFQGAARMYLLLGPTGFANLLIHLSQRKQQRLEKVAELRQELEALQDVDLMQEAGAVKRVFQEIGAWTDRLKRGVLFFLIQEKVPIQQEDEDIVFQGVPGVRVAAGRLEIDKRLLVVLKDKTQGAIFADMDENLAPRKKDFSGAMREVLTLMITYGVITPSIVTDNGFEEMLPRLNSLPEAVQHEMPVYADGSGNKYDADPTTGEYRLDEDFRKRMNTGISPKTYKLIEEKFFGPFVRAWRPFLLDTAMVFHRFYQENNRYPQSEDLPDIIQALREQNAFEQEHYKILRAFLEGDVGGRLKRIINKEDKRVERLVELTKDLVRQGWGEEEILYVHQVAALLEMVRLIYSDDKADQKERGDLLAHYLTLDSDGRPIKDKELRLFLREGVQIPLVPIRPRLLRDMYAWWWTSRFNTFKGNLPGGSHLDLYPGGMTTVNIKDKRANKEVPIAYAIEDQRIPPRHIEFSGDEYRRAHDLRGTQRPDDAVAVLQKERFPDLIVRNTSVETHDREARPELLVTKDLAVTKGLYGPEANVVIYRLIIDLLRQTLREVLLEGRQDGQPLMEKYRQRLGLDARQGSSPLRLPRPIGGIDLNPDWLDLQVRRDVLGRPLPLTQQSLKEMRIQGFLPVIVNITPIENMAHLLGVSKL